MATRAKSSKRPARRKPARRGLPSLPALEQRHRDILGLTLVALAVLLAFVAWGDRTGGEAGDALMDGLRWLAGLGAYAAPVILAAAGAVLVLAPLLPALRPFRTGGICAAAGLLLALAAGTLGLGPGGERETFARAEFEQRGGAAGDGLYWVASTLFSQIGAHLTAIVLLLAGALLLTGASLAGAVRAAGGGVADTTRRIVRTAGETASRMERLESLATPPHEPEPVVPPEDDTAELVVRATHVEAPPIDAARRFPDLFGSDDEPPDPAAEEPAEEPDAELEADEPDLPVRPDAEPEDLTPQGRYRQTVLDDPAFVWARPAPERVLKRSSGGETKPDTAGQEKTAKALVEALGHFGVDAKVTGMVSGPHITRYELRLAPGIKMAKVANLKDDLAYALAAQDVRILAPIPGKTAVGVEVPNARRHIVHLGDVYQEPPGDWSPLTVWLGKDVAGKAIGVDLARMPHLLVAGTTGAGKSGAINAMLTSILLRATPHEVRMVLVDPKQVELNHYDSIPHLLTPVITSPRMAATALQNLVREMEQRYGLMSLARARKLSELNAARAKRNEPPLPYILCVIDELADLMMVAPADVEDSIIRIAQKARAVGIHLVLATQSPRVDVITGMIKANVPSRIAFAVSSQTDSRVILDQNGAESLLGQGDMLFSPVGTSRLQRIQGAYVDEAQIAKLTEMWRKQGAPEFDEELLEEQEPVEEAAPDDFDPDEDPLLEDAITLVAQMGTASTSMLQRRLRLGYTRAGRLIDMLERRGIISGYEGSKPRQVLVGEGDLPRVLSNLSEAGRLGTGEVLDEAPEEAPEHAEQQG